MNIYKVSETDLTNIQFSETDTVKSVLQNVALILATAKGTVPMYRDFGIERDFLDLPIPEAEIRMVAPIREAVERWEPRATVRDVSFIRSEAIQGKLIPCVEIEIHEAE